MQNRGRDCASSTTPDAARRVRPERSDEGSSRTCAWLRAHNAERKSSIGGAYWWIEVNSCLCMWIYTRCPRLQIFRRIIQSGLFELFIWCLSFLLITGYSSFCLTGKYVPLNQEHYSNWHSTEGWYFIGFVTCFTSLCVYLCSSQISTHDFGVEFLQFIFNTFCRFQNIKMCQKARRSSSFWLSDRCFYF